MIRQFATYMLLFLAVTSCKKENAFDCFKSSGEQKTEIRYPGQFNTIEVFDKVDVTIVPGTDYKVEIEAGAHLTKNISTTVSEGKLSIKNNNTCNFVRGYKKRIQVTISVPVVRKIISNGVGDARLNGFTADSIDVVAESSGDIYLTGNYHQISTNSNGNGDIYLSGSCFALYAYLFGTNFLHAEDLVVIENIEVETVSVGDCFLNASGVHTLEATIWRIGNVYYKGAPADVIRNYREDCKGRLILQN